MNSTCNGTYKHSEDMYFNEETFTCCTVVMKEDQSLSKCNVKKMFGQWKEAQTKVNEEIKNDKVKNVLDCGNEYCDYDHLPTDGCYSTRQIENVPDGLVS